MMAWMARRCLSLFAIVLVSTACEVGHPLVDKYDPEEGFFRIGCKPPPPCDVLSPAVDNPFHAAERVSLRACTKSCALGEIAQADCPEDPNHAFPINAMCQDFEFQQTGETTELDLSGSVWTDVNLSLRAERPLRVIWSGGSLYRVSLDLHGPVDLQIEQLNEFEDLRIEGGSSPAGSPGVELAMLKGNTVSVGAKDKPFDGTLTFRAVQLSDVDVQASNLIFESVAVDHASLRAGAMTLTDFTLQHSLVDSPQRMRMSVFVIEDTNIRYCGDNRTVDGYFARSVITGCAESTVKLYNCNVGSSSLDGTFELDGASVENTRLGVSDVTRIAAYDSLISSAHLCSNLESLALGRGTQFKCSDCVDALNSESTQPACAFDDSGEVLLKNYCPVLRQIEALPLCEEGIPSVSNRVR